MICFIQVRVHNIVSNSPRGRKDDEGRERCSIWRLGLRDTHQETKEQDIKLSVSSHTTDNVKEAPGKEDEASGET